MEDGSWIRTSRSWKFEVLDTTKLVGATCLNTFPAQKRVEKREKTVVLEAGNRLEETPVETRGDP